MFRDNLPIGQFYEISADMQDPYVVCGGLQDNGHWCVPSATRTRTGISNRDGFNIGGGDGFYARLDPLDARTAIIESQDGRANRVNLATLERQAISPVTRPRADAAAGSDTATKRTRPLELEHADRDVELRSEDDLHRRAQYFSSRSIAARHGRRSARISRQCRSRDAGDDGRPRTASARCRGTTA